MATNHTDVEKQLWQAADELRANSKLKSSEYAVPVLGLIFLRFADHRFRQAQATLATTKTPKTRSRRAASTKQPDSSTPPRAIAEERAPYNVQPQNHQFSKTQYHAEGVLYVPEEARYETLLNLPEGSNVAKQIIEAMRAIERENEDIKDDVLPKTYNRLDNATLTELLRTFANIDMTETAGDAFGKIYEYFLGKFAMSEGQKGGEFFTPTTLVQLIVEVIEPYNGRIFDPACGSGGMFVQSARFVERHQRKPTNEISIYGQEKVAETVRLCRMNLAIHGLSGDIKQGNTYYEKLHNGVGTYDFVMANPPFNVDKVDKERLKNDPRFPFGIPRPDNANYLWIQLFYSALNTNGRAGFVMANSASDARGSEQDIRQKLIEAHAVDVMIAIGSNFFYTVTLPCTLWFLDRGKANTPRKEQVLFIDARHLYTQIDRAHREFTPAQITFIANIVRLYRGQTPDMGNADAVALMQEYTFDDGGYHDVPGLCKVATLEDIKAQGWSLNPGRYVGVAARAEEEFVFAERLQELNEELELLNREAHELEERIAENVAALLEN